MTLSLLIVDDHDAFRDFARSLLSGEFEVTGAAGDGETAIAEIERLSPDVVLLDVQMPGLDGFEVADRVCAPTGPRVVLTSSREASDYGQRLTRSPAHGFIPKQELSAQALAALVASG